MSKNELVVLGLLNQKSMHGYQLYHEIERTRMEYWAQVNLASIYNTLNRLEQGKMIGAKKEKPGKMPERSVYHLTKKGKEKLASLLEQTLKGNRMDPTNFVVGVALIKGLPKRKALDCLQFRKGVLQKDLTQLIKANKDEAGRMPLPLGFVVQSAIDHLRLGIKEIDGLLKQIQKMRNWR